MRYPPISRNFIRPTFQSYVLPCLLFFLPRHKFSAVSLLADVQHDISFYSILVVGVLLVRKSGRVGRRIEPVLP